MRTVCPLCPICKTTISEIKWLKIHVVNVHNMSETWANKNCTIAIPQKVKDLYAATSLFEKENEVVNKADPLEQLDIDVNDPAIIESFRKGPPYICAIQSCRKSWETGSYSLRQHYAQHDESLHPNRTTCPFCKMIIFELKNFKTHVVDVHNMSE